MTDIPVSRLVCRLRWLLRGTGPIKEELIGVCEGCLTGIPVSVSRDFGSLWRWGAGRAARTSGRRGGVMGEDMELVGKTL